MYDNDTGKHIYDELIMYGDWYEDKDGFIYIISPYNWIMENEGPDNETMDKLCAISRDAERNPTKEEAKNLGLIYIPDHLKRFSEDDGYYHA